MIFDMQILSKHNKVLAELWLTTVTLSITCLPLVQQVPTIAKNKVLETVEHTSPHNDFYIKRWLLALSLRIKLITETKRLIMFISVHGGAKMLLKKYNFRKKNTWRRGIILKFLF